MKISINKDIRKRQQSESQIIDIQNIVLSNSENHILQKIKEVRTLQKQYFRTRNTGVLQESKKAEKELDLMISGIKQTNLFD